MLEPPKRIELFRDVLGLVQERGQFLGEHPGSADAEALRDSNRFSISTGRLISMRDKYSLLAKTAISVLTTSGLSFTSDWKDSQEPCAARKDSRWFSAMSGSGEDAIS